MSRPVEPGQWGVERHQWDHMTCAGLCWGCGAPCRSHTEPEHIQRCLDNWGRLEAWPEETLRMEHFSGLDDEDINHIRTKLATPDVFNGRPCKTCGRPLRMVFDSETRDVVWVHTTDDANYHVVMSTIVRGART